MVGIACGTYTSVCITGALWYVMKTKLGAGAKELAAAEATAAKQIGVAADAGRGGNAAAGENSTGNAANASVSGKNAGQQGGGKASGGKKKKKKRRQ